MKITYECPCDDMLKYFTQDVLKQVDMKIKEVCVVAADDRLIHLRVKVWNEDGEPSVIGMVKGSWEVCWWVLLHEFNLLNEFEATMSCMLFDTKPSKIEKKTPDDTYLIKELIPESIMKEVGSSYTINKAYLITPTLIKRGYYMLKDTDEGISVTPVSFIDE